MILWIIWQLHRIHTVVCMSRTLDYILNSTWFLHVVHRCATSVMCLHLTFLWLTECVPLGQILTSGISYCFITVFCICLWDKCFMYKPYIFQFWVLITTSVLLTSNGSINSFVSTATWKLSIWAKLVRKHRKMFHFSICTEYSTYLWDNVS